MPFFPNPWFGAGRFTNTHVGWTAGGGVEWMFLPNWSVKAEYLYYDLLGGVIASPSDRIISDKWVNKSLHAIGTLRARFGFLMTPHSAHLWDGWFRLR